MAIPGSRPNNRFILIIGLVCAVIAGGGMLYLLKDSGGGQQRSVLVFKIDLSAGTSITSDDLTTANVADSSLPAATISDSSQVIGKEVVNNVQANTVVIPALLVAPGQGVATASSGGRLDITAGYEAVSIPAAVSFTSPGPTNPYELVGGSGDLYAVDGFIQAEDHIDMLVAVPNAGGPLIRYSFQDVRVLKVGTNGAAAGGTATSMVIELPRGQAELMTQLTTVTCNTSATNTNACKSPLIVKFALRPRCEYGDRNYDIDVKNYTGDTVAQYSALTGTDKTAAQAKLAKNCVFPYPNYEPLTGGGLPAPGGTQPLHPSFVPDGGVTPQSLSNLF